MRPKVLLVDDEPSIRESLRKLLQAEQYDVILAANGKEAIETFRSATIQFDLVLTDLDMPLRNGWASVDQLLEVDPWLPIILLTGMPNQRELAETSHVSALVEKPIDVPALLHLMQELLAETQGTDLQRPPLGHPPFHYVPPSQSVLIRHVDPHSHWGLNE